MTKLFHLICLSLSILLLLSQNAFASTKLDELSLEQIQDYRSQVLEKGCSWHHLIRKEFPDLSLETHANQVLFELGLFNKLFAEDKENPRIAYIADKFETSLDKVMSKFVARLHNSIKTGDQEQSNTNRGGQYGGNFGGQYGGNFGGQYGGNFGGQYGGNFGGANFGAPNFGGANFGAPNLGGANFGGTNFGGANLGTTNFDPSLELTKPDKADRTNPMDMGSSDEALSGPASSNPNDTERADRINPIDTGSPDEILSN